MCLFRYLKSDLFFPNQKKTPTKSDSCNHADFSTAFFNKEKDFIYSQSIYQVDKIIMNPLLVYAQKPF
jgi:hypothetical protein